MTTQPAASTAEPSVVNADDRRVRLRHQGHGRHRPPAGRQAKRIERSVTIATVIEFVATMSGSSLAVTTGLAAGVVLLGTAAAGFHDLAGICPARLPGPAPLSAKTR